MRQHVYNVYGVGSNPIAYIIFIMKKYITTLEMELVLMREFDVRQNIIVPNVSFGIRINNKYLHECDLLILSNSNYATEIEIKISKSDLLQDKKKTHKHDHIAIKNFYYAVPEFLEDIALKNIPENAGLIVITEAKHFVANQRYLHATIVKKPKARKDAYKWQTENILKLTRLGCMRIYGLKKKIFENKV